MVSSVICAVPWWRRIAANGPNDCTTLPSAPSLTTRIRLGGVLVVRPGVMPGMIGGPVARDVDAAGDPHAGKATDMVEQLLQPGGAGGVADDAHVQSDRQHLRLRVALLVEEVECVPAVGEEVIAGRERAAAELRIVG